MHFKMLVVITKTSSTTAAMRTNVMSVAVGLLISFWANHDRRGMARHHQYGRDVLVDSARAGQVLGSSAEDDAQARFALCSGVCPRDPAGREPAVLVQRGRSGRGGGRQWSLDRGESTLSGSRTSP